MYSQILKDFKVHLEASGYDTNYWYKIKYYLIYCTTNNIDIYHVNLLILNQYFLTLRQQSYSNGYINNFVKALRFFYKYLRDVSKVTEDIYQEMYKIKIMRTEIKVKDFVTKEELEDLISTAMTYCTFMNLDKLKVILYFLFYTGLRRNEFINLKREDIKLEERAVIVRIPTKNRSERTVFFPLKVKKLLIHYFQLEPGNINAFNIKNNEVSRLINFLKTCVSGKKNITMHMFRHSFANMLARAGIDVKIAQSLLGHKSVLSTLIYYNPDIKIVKQIYNEKIR